MIMRKIGLVCLIVAGFFSVVFSSCSKDDPEPEAKLVVSTEALTFSADGETKPFHVQSNTAFQVSSAESWCTLSPTSGADGTIKIEATVPKNPTAANRTSVITVTAGSLTKQLTVTQSGSIILNLSDDEFEVPVGGQQITIQIESSGTYSIDIEGAWIDEASGSTNTTQKFDIDPNLAYLGRTGTITFTLNGVSKTVSVVQAGNPLNIADDNTGMSSNAMTLAAAIKVGWNLGNTLEAMSVNNGVYSANETMWGNAMTTKTLIDGIKAAGFDAVRLPCAWTGYLENTTNYRIKDSWLKRVSEVLDYCIANDMHVIINIHWDGGWLEEHPLYANQVDVNKKQKALWEQIAVYFRNYDEHLLFAGTNEVHANYGNPTTENITVQQSFNQTFVDAVRSTGGKNKYRNLIVQAYNTNITHANNYMTMPTDAAGVTNRLMAEVHFYDPYDFTLDNSATSKYLWGADFAGNPNCSTWGQEAWVDEAFGIVKTKFIDNSIPVILGEYGLMYRSSLPEPALTSHKQARVNYLHYVNQAAKAKGLKTFYWDSGFTGNGGSGLFNRATGAQVYADAIDAIVSAYD